jgi:hypothetical protein
VRAGGLKSYEARRAGGLEGLAARADRLFFADSRAGAISGRYNFTLL